MFLVLACAMLSSMSAFAMQGEDKPTAPVKIVIVEGQVTDPIGAGQKDVTVTVRWKSADGGKGDVIATTTTDAMGDFVVTSPDPIQGDVWVTLSKAQFADMVREVRVGESDTPPFLGEMLEGNLALTGRVTDFLTEQPVAAAAIVLRTNGPDRKERTDDQGRFRLTSIAPGEGELVVEVEGYGRERRKIAKLEDSSELNVTLKPERILHINIVDDLDRPIRGVTVECADQPRGDFRTMMTDESGTTTLKGIHFDAFMLGVRLTHREFVSDSGFERQITTPSKERESTHRFVMARAGRIAGRVTAAKTDQLIHGARLITGDAYDDDSPRDWTDDQGRFEILGVPPGATTVTLHLHDYAPELKVAEVKGGETTTLDFQLHPGMVLEGIVKIEGGGAATAVEVVAWRWRSKNTLGLRAMTDAEGRFRMEDAPMDDFEIGVAGPGGKMVTNTVRALPGAVVELVVPHVAMTGGGNGNKSLLNVGDSAPMLILKTLGGETLNFTELKGKIVLVEFWATWCPPCLEEMPHLIAIHEKYATRKDLVMIGINRDHELGTVADYLKNNPKIAWPQVFGEKGGVPQACEAFGVTGIPELFILGPDGKIIDAHLRGQQIIERVESLMKDRPPG
jgi:thiol-disulfide isomerase/thioredoxin